VKLERRLLPVAAVLAAGAGSFLALRVIPYQLDDAYIAYRFARNLAAGLGFVFNPGGPVVEGFTSPAWVLLLSGAAGLFGPEALPVAARVLGVGAYLAAIVAAWSAARGRANGLGAASAAALLATSSAATFYAATGMEAPLFLLVVLLFLGSLAGALPRSLGLAAGAAAVWVRPEGAWLLVALVAWHVGAGAWRTGAVRTSLPYAAAVAAGGAALLVLRLALFHAALPETYYAKGSDPGFGWSYVSGFLGGLEGAPLLVLGTAGALLGGPRHRGWWLAGLSFVPAVVLEGGDWMPTGRFLLPALGAFALAASGLGEARVLPKLRPLLIVLVLVGVGVQGRSALQWTRRARSTQEGIRREAAFVADWVAASGARSVAAVDIGLLGYTARTDIVDLGGLTDPRIGRLPGRHLDKPVDPRYVVDERAPDVVVLRIAEPPWRGDGGGMEIRAISGVEQRLYDDGAFRRRYRLLYLVVPQDPPRRPYYGKAVFARDDFRPAPAATVPQAVIRLTPPAD